MSTAGVTDIRLMLDFCDHRKTRRMVEHLGEQSVRCLLRLFCFAARSRPLGVLDRMSPRDIAEEAGWIHWENPAKFPQTPDQFCAVLASQEVQYLDLRPDGFFEIHEWSEYQTWVAGAPARKQRSKAANAAKYGVKYEQRVMSFEVDRSKASIPSIPQDPVVAVSRSIPSIPSDPVVAESVREPDSSYGTVLGPPPPPRPNPLPLPLPPPLPPPASPARSNAPNFMEPKAGRGSVAAQRLGSVLVPAPIYKAIVRILRFDLGWYEHDAEALVRAIRLKAGEDPHETDPAIVWPLANAFYANERKDIRKPYAFVSGCTKEPQDRFQQQAKDRLELAMRERMARV